MHKLEVEKKRIEDEEVQACTFTPATNKSNVSAKYFKQTLELMYKQVPEKKKVQVASNYQS